VLAILYGEVFMFPNVTETTPLIRLVNLLPVTPLDDRILDVIKLFASDITKKYSLQELAEAAQVCSRQLERIFHQETQLTPLQYLKWLRLELAADLLHDKTLSIKAVRLQVGYGDASNFTHDFKQHFGRTPALHQQQARWHCQQA
jgi:AraC family transcriptional regulator, glycine betaine-responsive activator